jgi:hypothetical protein
VFAVVKKLSELPEFTNKMSNEQKMKICKMVFNRLNDREHPVIIDSAFALSREEYESKALE